MEANSSLDRGSDPLTRLGALRLADLSPLARGEVIMGVWPTPELTSDF
jgi:hypothetical protein